VTGRAAYPEGGENRKQKQGQPGIYPGAGEGILSASIMLFRVLKVVMNAKTALILPLLLSWYWAACPNGSEEEEAGKGPGRHPPRSWR